MSLPAKARPVNSTLVVLCSSGTVLGSINGDNRTRSNSRRSKKEASTASYFPKGKNLFTQGWETPTQAAPSPPPTQLFRVCEQLFHETSILSCREVTALCFDNAYVMNRYLKEDRMSLEQRKAIRVLFCHNMPCKTTMKKFSGLKEVIMWTKPKDLEKEDSYGTKWTELQVLHH